MRTAPEVETAELLGRVAFGALVLARLDALVGDLVGGDLLEGDRHRLAGHGGDLRRHDGAEPIAFDEMKRHLLDAGLITRKLPEQLEIVDALPRNPSGKIVKAQLQKQFGG